MTTTDTPGIDPTVTVEEPFLPPEPAPEPEPESEKVEEATGEDAHLEETTGEDAKPEEAVFEDSRLAETVLDGARPIIPAPANLAPTPPAHDEAETARLPQPQTGSLDLTEPILDILTNPTV